MEQAFVHSSAFGVSLTCTPVFMAPVIIHFFCFEYKCEAFANTKIKLKYYGEQKKRTKEKVH